MKIKIFFITTILCISIVEAQNNLTLDSNNLNLTGDENVALGYSSFSSNTTGTANVGVGAYTLKLNTTGKNNTALGSKSLRTNTIGNYNAAIGYSSLTNNIWGEKNSVLGAYSLSSNTYGSYNTSVGYEALFQNETGNYNNVLGYNSMRFCGTSIMYNNAIGSYALKYVTGNRNNAFGYEALMRLTSGYENIAFGNAAGQNITTGYRNIFLGSYIETMPETSSYNIALGYRVGTTGIGNNNIIIGKKITLPNGTSNAMNIGGVLYGTGFQPDLPDTATYLPVNGKIGINIVNPSATLEVGGDMRVGINSKLKLSNWSNGLGAWIDIPTVAGTPSGIGSGGIGYNAWIGYAGNTNQWFMNSALGDICYRNTAGRLLFGNDGTKSAAVAISNNNVGIGVMLPTKILQVYKSDANTNLSLSNTSALELWNPIGSTNTGSQINFRSDACTGNAGIGAVIGYLNRSSSTSGSNGNLVFGVKSSASATSVNQAMTIQSDGNVGIGTTNPNAKLDVGSGIISGANVGGLAVTGYNIDPYSTNHLLPFQNSGKLILGWNYSGGRGEQSIIANSSPALAGGFSFYNYPYNSSVATHLMTISGNGKVGIGTSTPDSLLTVKGGIHARSVVVDLTGPLADYVFDTNYKLMPLSEVEQFVNTNKHLPSIPTATEVQTNGMNMGDMQNKMLQKIEELTLYVIQQQKEIDALKLQLQQK